LRVVLAAVLGLLAVLSPAAAVGTLDVKDVQCPRRGQLVPGDGGQV